MPDNGSLEEKLKGWCETHPSKVLPVKAAAALLRMRQIINNEDWESAELKSFALKKLDYLMDYLYLVDSVNSNDPKQKRDICVATFNMLDPRNAGKFNTLSSPSKTGFINKAKNLLKQTDDMSYSDFKNKVIGASLYCDHNLSPMVVPAISSKIAELGEILQDVQHPMFQEHKERIFLKGGSKSIEEMIAYTTVYSKITANFPLVGNSLGLGSNQSEHMHIAVQNILDVLYGAQSDLGENALKQLREKTENAASSVSKTHYMNADMFINMANHFLSHQSDKMRLGIRAYMLSELKNLHEAAHLHMLQLSGGQYDLDSLAEWRGAVEDHGKTFFPEYKTPDVDELKESLRETVPASTLAALTTLLDERPAGMKETVIHHYVEPEYIRKGRQTAFKAKWTPDGEDGPKRAFIKGLAVNHADDLVEVGFSNDDILAMRETGKLPENCGWNVEHIIDREHGGTNHVSNFILMPEEINTAKDQLKKIQKSLNPNADEGCWMISWVPEKLPDGTYPKVFKGHLNNGFIPQLNVQPDDNVPTLH